MTYIQNLFSSRDNNADGNTYVGQTGRIWWNPDTNAFYYSDGTTAGGIPVSTDPTSNATFNVVTANTLTSTTGTLNLTGNINITGNISAATTTKIGGVRAGPGANISDTGLLTIDSSNVPFSFGNFFANNNILSIVNVNEDMILATDGSAEIQLIGNVGFYKPDGLPPNVANRYASFNDQGQVQIFVTATDGAGAVQIVGTTTGNVIEPGIEGTMLHITGQLDTPSRVYYDGNGEYVSLVARRWNGNVAVPTQVLANEDVLRINATAATDAGVGNVAMAQIQFRALENQTTTAQGSTLNFIVTPVGSSAASRVEVANVTVANGVTATKFTTAGTVIATGNITGGNVLTVGLISATGNITSGNVLTGGLISATGNITGGNITTVGLISATGNLTAGNVSGTTVNATTHTGTTVSVTGNVSGGNVISSALVQGVTVSASGNVTGGNILTAGLMSATGGITSGDGISDSLGSVRSIPQNGKSANYTLEATDNGRMINITSGNVTVPAGVFASPFGQTVSIYNNQNASNAVVQGAGVTLRLAGTAATGNRTMARYGLSTIVCVAANTFVISGAGLT
jgi:hypothetical protein